MVRSLTLRFNLLVIIMSLKAELKRASGTKAVKAFSQSNHRSQCVVKYNAGIENIGGQTAQE